MLDRALEEMQKKESKIVSPSLRLKDQLVDARRWHPRNWSSSPRWLSSAWFPGFSQARGKKPSSLCSPARAWPKWAWARVRGVSRSGAERLPLNEEWVGPFLPPPAEF